MSGSDANHALYAEMMKLRMPTGPVWQDDSNGATMLDLLYRALTGEQAQQKDDADAFLNNFIPDTATDFLADWERLLGLLPGMLTVEQRRAQIITLLRGFPPANAANIQAAADIWNVGAIVWPSIFGLFFCFSKCTAQVRGPIWRSVVRIDYTGPANPAFEAAMRARVPLTVRIVFMVT